MSGLSRSLRHASKFTYTSIPWRHCNVSNPFITLGVSSCCPSAHAAAHRLRGGLGVFRQHNPRILLLVPAGNRLLGGSAVAREASDSAGGDGHNPGPPLGKATIPSDKKRPDAITSAEVEAFLAHASHVRAGTLDEAAGRDARSPSQFMDLALRVGRSDALARRQLELYDVGVALGVVDSPMVQALARELVQSGCPRAALEVIQWWRLHPQSMQPGPSPGEVPQAFSDPRSAPYERGLGRGPYPAPVSPPLFHQASSLSPGPQASTASSSPSPALSAASSSSSSSSSQLRTAPPVDARLHPARWHPGAALVRSLLRSFADAGDAEGAILTFYAFGGEGAAAGGTTAQGAATIAATMTTKGVRESTTRIANGAHHGAAGKTKGAPAWASNIEDRALGLTIGVGPDGHGGMGHLANGLQSLEQQGGGNAAATNTKPRPMAGEGFGTSQGDRDPGAVSSWTELLEPGTRGPLDAGTATGTSGGHEEGMWPGALSAELPLPADLPSHGNLPHSQRMPAPSQPHLPLSRSPPQLLSEAPLAPIPQPPLPLSGQVCAQIRHSQREDAFPPPRPPPLLRGARDYEAVLQACARAGQVDRTFALAEEMDAALGRRGGEEGGRWTGEASGRWAREGQRGLGEGDARLEGSRFKGQVWMARGSGKDGGGRDVGGGSSGGGGGGDDAWMANRRDVGGDSRGGGGGAWTSSTVGRLLQACAVAGDPAKVPRAIAELRRRGLRARPGMLTHAATAYAKAGDAAGAFAAWEALGVAVGRGGQGTRPGISVGGKGGDWEERGPGEGGGSRFSGGVGWVGTLERDGVVKADRTSPGSQDGRSSRGVREGPGGPGWEPVYPDTVACNALMSACVRGGVPQHAFSDVLLSIMVADGGGDGGGGGGSGGHFHVGEAEQRDVGVNGDGMRGADMPARERGDVAKLGPREEDVSGRATADGSSAGSRYGLVGNPVHASTANAHAMLINADTRAHEILQQQPQELPREEGEELEGVRLGQVAAPSASLVFAVMPDAVTCNILTQAAHNAVGLADVGADVSARHVELVFQCIEAIRARHLSTGTAVTGSVTPGSSTVTNAGFATSRSNDSRTGGTWTPIPKTSSCGRATPGAPRTAASEQAGASEAANVAEASTGSETANVSEAANASEVGRSPYPPWLPDRKSCALLVTIAGRSAPTPALAVGAARRALSRLAELGAPPSVFAHRALLRVCGHAAEPDAAESALAAARGELGRDPDGHMYASAIMACGRAGELARAMGVAERMEAGGVPLTDAVFNHLLAACAVSGAVRRAFLLLDRMSARGIKPGLVAYNSLVAACATAGKPLWALEVMERMRAEGVEPDATTYHTAILAWGRSGNADRAFATLQEMATRGLQPTPMAFLRLITACKEARRPMAALQALDIMERHGVATSPPAPPTSQRQPVAGSINSTSSSRAGVVDDGSSWWDGDAPPASAMVQPSRGGTSQRAGGGPAGSARKALQLLKEAYTTAMAACAAEGMLEHVTSLAERMHARAGARPDPVMYTALVSACRRPEDVERMLTLAVADLRQRHPADAATASPLGSPASPAAAGAAFTHSPTAPAVSAVGTPPLRLTPLFNAAMSVFVRTGEHARVFGVRDRMRAQGVALDYVSYKSLLSACLLSNATADTALQLLQEMVHVDGLSPDVGQYNCALALMARQGEARGAEALFADMVTAGTVPDKHTFTAIMQAHGNAIGDVSRSGATADASASIDRAWGVLDRMKEAGVARDVVTYGTLATLCLRAGSPARAQEAVDAMFADGVDPDYVMSRLMAGIQRSAQLERDPAVLGMKHLLGLDGPSREEIYMEGVPRAGMPARAKSGSESSGSNGSNGSNGFNRFDSSHGSNGLNGAKRFDAHETSTDGSFNGHRTGWDGSPPSHVASEGSPAGRRSPAVGADSRLRGPGRDEGDRAQTDELGFAQRMPFGAHIEGRTREQDDDLALREEAAPGNTAAFLFRAHEGVPSGGSRPGSFPGSLFSFDGHREGPAQHGAPGVPPKSAGMAGNRSRLKRASVSGQRWRRGRGLLQQRIS
eukprot:jgi/Mesvir1/24283/Mv10981-RA.1